MAEKMSKHRERYKAKYVKTTLLNYNLNDEVIVFYPKMKTFSKEGKVLFFNPPPSDLLGPRDYTIEFKEGGTRRVNQQWLIPAPVPASA